MYHTRLRFSGPILYPNPEKSCKCLKWGNKWKTHQMNVSEMWNIIKTTGLRVRIFIQFTDIRDRTIMEHWKDGNSGVCCGYTLITRGESRGKRAGEQRGKGKGSDKGKETIEKGTSTLSVTSLMHQSLELKQKYIVRNKNRRWAIYKKDCNPSAPNRESM